jgi:hypothetical protein
VPGPDAPDPGADVSLVLETPDRTGIAPGTGGILVVGFGKVHQPPGFILDRQNQDDLFIHVVGNKCQGADCDESRDDCAEGACCPPGCEDSDGDGHGSGADCSGQDCNDANNACWVGVCCLDCIDTDGDGFGTGPLCAGTDCDDTDPTCRQGACCVACQDSDGDGYGTGGDCTGADCNDADDNCWLGTCCLDCIDTDGDGRGVGNAPFSATVEIGTDGTNFVYAGNINERQTSTDIARAKLATASFVRLVVLEGGTNLLIDAFEALE